MSKKYYGSCSFSNGRVDMGNVKHLEDINTFSELVKEVLNEPIQQNITRSEFHQLSKAERSDRKKVAYLVPGSYSTTPIPRDAQHTPERSNVLFIDLDQAASGHYPAKRFVDDPEQLTACLSPYAFCAYQTASSTVESPKLRICVSCDVPASEYSTAVYFIVHRLGLGEGDFDKVSTEVTRAMYRPVSYRGEQVDPILISCPEGQDVTEVDLSDTALPSPRAKRSSDSDDIEFLRAPLEGFTIQDVRDCLVHIDADCGYSTWLEIAMALKHQFPRAPESDQALDAFDEWSARAKQKYEGRESVESKWNAVSTTARGRVPRTIRSVIRIAEEAGWSSVQFSRKSFDTISKWIADAARGTTDLISEGTKRIAAAHLESPVERDVLLGLLQRRLSSVGSPVSKVVLKKQLDAYVRSAATKDNGDPTTLPESQMPQWARGIVYVSEPNEFYQRVTDKTFKVESLDNMFNVMLNPNPETGKSPINASDYLLNLAKIPRVSNYQYAPRHFDQAIIKHKNKKYINTYQASYVEADRSDIAAGDIVRDHIANLIRELEYQELLIDFLAYHVQCPGGKVRWAPVIQGAQGCGKTALFAMMQAVLGADNAKSINADTLMNSRFTSWATGAQIRAIEEVRVIGEGKHLVMNKIKPYITNGEISMEKKGKDEVSVPNCTNYMLFTNHHDALALQDGDRRYFVLKSGLQTKLQVRRLGDDYFKKLFHTIEFRAAGIRAWLENWTITGDFNADGHAPETPYMHEMIEDASSPLANIIRDLLRDEGHPLVRQDLVSSLYLGNAVAHAGMKVTGSSVGMVLREFGYEKIGRVRLDNEQQNIWVKEGTTFDWKEETQKRFKSIGAQHFNNESDLL